MVKTHKRGPRSARKGELCPLQLRRTPLAELEHDVEELSIIVQYGDRMHLEVFDSCSHAQEDISAHGGFHSIGPLCGFMRLRRLRVSAEILIGKPSLSNRYFSTLRHEEVSLAAFYSPQQEKAFYEHLPKAIEVLIIVDCPNAMYGCIRRFLQSAHIPPRLKRIELAYTCPAPNNRHWPLAEMSEWMSDSDSEWCYRFPGESFATKKQLEDFALGRGLVLIQRIDENYNDF